MIDVLSIKFKNRGKCYFFSPNGLDIKSGDKVIVETAKGLELADCCRGCHSVPDEAVVQPLRPAVRIATADDLRVAELNKKREKEAFDICQQKIIEHGLDMKLVDVECNFEGSKTMFFFTSDGRVDFRELVKDLAGIFRNRIELRQIGVRDEAKMIGGIGICGRPYCCSQFLDEFHPVSTKMAKVQSLSLNPTKISGSCGRLMCCLRYEQEAYEDLVKKVPKQGAFVETKDGFGTAVQVNLLRQTVQVRLDDEGDDTVRTYKANELCAVPGGRPKDGEKPVSTFVYVPVEEEAEEPPEDPWRIPFAEPIIARPEPAQDVQAEPKEKQERKRRDRRSRKPKQNAQVVEVKREEKPEGGENRQGSRRKRGGRGGAKSVKVEAHMQGAKGAENAPAKESAKRQNPREQTAAPKEGAGKAPKEGTGRRRNNRRNYNKPKQKPAGESGGQA